jgi:hypothetical protein
VWTDSKTSCTTFLNDTVSEERSLCPHELPDPWRNRPQQRDVGVAVALLGTRHETTQMLVRRWGLIHHLERAAQKPHQMWLPLDLSMCNDHWEDLAHLDGRSR